MMPGTILGAILAGGRSQRLGGGDKCLLPLGDGTILDHVIAALRPQTAALLLNSNSAAALFARTGLDVRADILPGRRGPLAGLHTAMLWARAQGAPAVLTAPGDTPFLPRDLAARLAAGWTPERAAIAARRGTLHPVIGLWPCALAERLEAHLAGGVYQVRRWLGEIGFQPVAFDDGAADPFWNINTPEDLRLARAAVAP